MKITAAKVAAKDLQPGDLFSTAGPEYWDKPPRLGVVGERVYVRTDVTCPADQADAEVYRIKVECEVANDPGNLRDAALAWIGAHEQHCTTTGVPGTPCWGERANLVAFLCHSLGLRGKRLYEDVARLVADYDQRCADPGCKHERN